MKFLCAFLLSLAPLFSRAADFSIPTKDGVTALTGQIDYPANLSKKVPLVVMLPGTGLFDRDVHFGKSGTERDFLFRDLSKKLNERGLATLRYDFRGVSCNSATAPACPSCKTEQDRSQNFIEHCLDFSVRKTVTPENIRSDIEQVYSLGVQDPKIDKTKIVVFAHSEGSVHIAHLVADAKLKPAGLVMLGMCVESPRRLLHWQVTERLLSWLKPDADGRVSLDQIKAIARRLEVNEETYLQYLTGAEVHGAQLKDAISSGEPVTLNALEAIYEELYQRQRDSILRASDEDPWPSEKFVQGSSRWWKMFFVDDTSPAELLKSYPGRISFNNGSEDSQTPGVREFGLLKPLLPSYVGIPKVLLYQGKGHSLGEDPILGPMDVDAQRQLLDNFNWVLEL